MTITLTREEAQQVLDALEAEHSAIYGTSQTVKATELLRTRLAQSEPEPVAWIHTMDNTEGCEENEPWIVFTDSEENPFGIPGEDYSESYFVTSEPLYTASPKREFIGLTDEEIKAMRHMRDWTAGWTDIKYAREIEAKLKEKNT